MRAVGTLPRKDRDSAPAPTARESTATADADRTRVRPNLQAFRPTTAPTLRRQLEAALASCPAEGSARCRRSARATLPDDQCQAEDLRGVERRDHADLFLAPLMTLVPAITTVSPR